LHEDSRLETTRNEKAFSISEKAFSCIFRIRMAVSR
jgi:hypothetical protein